MYRESSRFYHIIYHNIYHIILSYHIIYHIIILLFYFSYATKRRSCFIFLSRFIPSATNFQRRFARRDSLDLRRQHRVHFVLRGLLGRRRQSRAANARESTGPEATRASAHGSVHDPPRCRVIYATTTRNIISRTVSS